MRINQLVLEHGGDAVVIFSGNRDSFFVAGAKICKIVSTLTSAYQFDVCGIHYVASVRPHETGGFAQWLDTLHGVSDLAFLYNAVLLIMDDNVILVRFDVKHRFCGGYEFKLMPQVVEFEPVPAFGRSAVPGVVEAESEGKYKIWIDKQRSKHGNAMAEICKETAACPTIHQDQVQGGKSRCKHCLVHAPQGKPPHIHVEMFSQQPEQQSAE